LKSSSRVCCVCGEKFACLFDGKPYCNKHYLRMYNNGTIEPQPRKRTTKIVFLDDYAEIVTSKRQRILVDTADVEFLGAYSWCISKTGYAVANIEGKVTKLHRYLLSPADDQVVDHKNGNTLDNRRCNLRITTQKNNSRNVAAARGSATGVLGISLTPAGKYRARIMVDGKEIRLGHFATLDSAVAARRAAEERYFGSFAPSISREDDHDDSQVTDLTVRKRNGIPGVEVTLRLAAAENGKEVYS